MGWSSLVVVTFVVLVGCSLCVAGPRLAKARGLVSEGSGPGLKASGPGNSMNATNYSLLFG